MQTDGCNRDRGEGALSWEWTCSRTDPANTSGTAAAKHNSLLGPDDSGVSVNGASLDQACLRIAGETWSEKWYSLSIFKLEVLNVTLTQVQDLPTGEPSTLDLCALNDGEKELFGYLVRCALGDEQSVTWTCGDGPDAEELTFPGSLGVAPEWKNT
ncbi:MAG: hypothetical protein AAGC55_11870, partial [Myxococcota bacterium]